MGEAILVGRDIIAANKAASIYKHAVYFAVQVAFCNAIFKRVSARVSNKSAHVDARIGLTGNFTNGKINVCVTILRDVGRCS